jgi:hypothetical protein
VPFKVGEENSGANRPNIFNPVFEVDGLDLFVTSEQRFQIGGKAFFVLEDDRAGFGQER